MGKSIQLIGAFARALTILSLAIDEPLTTQHSYLLRLWRSGVDGSWRASLQVVQTGERHMFADLGSLLAFLIEQARPPPAV